MATLPRFTAHAALTDIRYLINGLHSVQGEDVTMSSGQTSGITPTFRHPPGTVLQYRTSTGEFELADSADVDQDEAASVNTLITNPGAGGWDGNVVITGHWGTITVALSGDNTDAAVAAAIIAAVAAVDPEYGFITAADATGSVSITNIDVGEGTWLRAVHSTVATMFGAAGATAVGTSPEVRVTTEFAELQDIDGNAVDALVANLRSGYFDESELSSLTTEAKAILTRRGSRFG